MTEEKMDEHIIKIIRETNIQISYSDSIKNFKNKLGSD